MKPLFSLRPQTLLTLLLIFCFSAAQAQKETDIVNKLRTALRDGGLEKPEPSMAAKGTFSYQEVSFSGAMYYQKPNSRMEMMFPGATFIQFHNDTIEWEYNAFEKRHYIRNKDHDYNEQELNKNKLLDFASRPLLYYKKLHHQLTFKGEQKIDSIQAWVLELVLKDEKKTQATFYIDKRTNLIYKSQSGSAVRWYANYKNIERYVYPTVMAYSDQDVTQMLLKFDEMSVGKPIPDSLFTIPKEAYANRDQYEQKLNALLAEGDSLATISQYDASLEKFNEALKIDPNSYAAYNGRGMAKNGKGKYYEAIADLNIALEIAPDGSRAFNNRGLAKFYLGDNKSALEDYTEALKLDTAFFVAYKNRGLLLYREKKYAEAEADFVKAMALRPEDGDSYFKYGVTVAQLGRYDEALTYYAKAAGLSFDTEELHNYRGVSEYKLAKYEAAANSFREAIKKNADNTLYLDNLGNALYRAESYAEAIEVFEKYLVKKPKSDGMHNMIGLCKYREEDYKGAVIAFTKAIELNDEVAVYFANRADARISKDDYEGGISDYTQSITLNGSDASVFYRRGLARIRSSKKLEGCVDLGTAQDMKYEGAKEAIMKHCN